MRKKIGIFTHPIILTTASTNTAIFWNTFKNIGILVISPTLHKRVIKTPRPKTSQTHVITPKTQKSAYPSSYRQNIANTRKTLNRCITTINTLKFRISICGIIPISWVRYREGKSIFLRFAIATITKLGKFS